MTESPFSLQLRHEGAWLTVKGVDFDDFYANLATAIGQAAADQHLTPFQAVQNLAAGGLNPQPVNQQWSAPQSSPAPGQWSAPPAPPAYQPPAPPAPPAAPPAPVGGDWKDNAPQCAHGRMRPYEGTNSRGQYKAFFCAAPRETPREQKCSPLDGVTLKAWG